MNFIGRNKTRTAILLVDPYNDFLSPGGKIHAHAKPVMDKVGTVSNMLAIVKLAREISVPIVYVPHHRATPTDFAGWRHVTPYQAGGHDLQVFAEGTWGGSWHESFTPQTGDTVVKEHWSSGFAGTDLDIVLKQIGVECLILIGLLANTCLEGTGRAGMELGYHITLVRDATAAFSDEAMHAAHDINGPTYAHAVVTTAEVLASLSALDAA
ncbi:MAG: isochorismatase family cysteine hydrolase [Steroidobacteraceae bacterium]